MCMNEKGFAWEMDTVVEDPLHIHWFSRVQSTQVLQPFIRLCIADMCVCSSSTTTTTSSPSSRA